MAWKPKGKNMDYEVVGRNHRRRKFRDLYKNGAWHILTRAIYDNNLAQWKGTKCILLPFYLFWVCKVGTLASSI